MVVTVKHVQQVWFLGQILMQARFRLLGLTGSTATRVQLLLSREGTDVLSIGHR